ncbi:MAG TPA: glucose-6-phosphate dehydrogenase [Chlamydiales bacterium]|nr:glucose-6-phosphate dehydrogenase [Chlamydiales bacterium]
MPKSNPLIEEGRASRNIDPCILVIFGATGDLTGRKLAPALYNLGREGLLPPNFACVGFARREKSHEAFRDELKQDVATYSRTKPLDEPFWKNFQEKIFYHRSEFDDDEGYKSLAAFLSQIDSRNGTRGNRVFYLSVQPKFFPLIIEKLRKFGLVYDAKKVTDKWSRVIIEKPFGHDSASAAKLQTEIAKNLDESQIYRIDHYLGKETVQNLLVFRFANSIFESLWNYKHIDHVQITVAEDIGIGTRGHFFEEEGLLRDIVQNHMMQLLSLVAMEPPVNLSAQAIQDEKVKVLQSIRPLTPEDFEQWVVRGQYGPGFINGEKVVGYAQEKDVNPHSPIETYTAIRFFIDNWRWAGVVPFYLRGGKRLPKRGTEIAIIFKDAPGVLFQLQEQKHDRNVLAIRIQPDEGIALKINCKVPGPTSPIQPVKMDFRYGSYFGQSPPEAYERLIWDCILGDSTLFARSDEVAHSWQILTPILNYWRAHPPKNFPNYASGTWGPEKANEMMAKDHRTWRIL